MNTKISQMIELMDFNSIDSARKDILLTLSKAIKRQLELKGTADIIFICTHNSRRSQMAQVWASVFADIETLHINAFSGGTEKTAVAPQVLSAFKHFSFNIISENEIHKISTKNNRREINLFSKIYDDSVNPNNNFIAAMTCSDADENCPIIQGCSDRIPLTYNDPKRFDGSVLEETMYQYEAFKIGTEMKYTFSLLKSL